MKITKVLILILISVILASTSIACLPKAQTLTNNDLKYIFATEDIMEVDVNKYQAKQFKDGKPYSFFKNTNSLNEFNCIYSRILVRQGIGEIDLITTIDISSDTERARSLYKMMINVPTKFVRVSSKEYDVDEIKIAESVDNFTLVLRKGKLVYKIEIDGSEIKQEQVKDGIMEKVQYISRNGIDGYRI
ncbi:MAG: hypothetical protein ACM3UZ_09010 [Acidobacteriota bacterium]